MKAEIEHVSDTALYVAGLRALESRRPDGLIHDELAARLAGERGMELAHTLPGSDLMTFGLSARFRAIDEIVLNAIRNDGVSAVVNVGAGLDTRPWRLDLPEQLLWIEVDFPAMIEYKNEGLGDARPRCRLEQISLDLADAEKRREIWRRTPDAPTLLITEGLLMYLSAATVRGLASEAVAKRSVRFWAFDIVSQELRRRLHGDSTDQIEQVREASHLDAPDIIDAVRESGWGPKEHRTFLTESLKMPKVRLEEIARQMAERNEPRPPAPPEGDVSGMWLFEATS